VKAGSLPRGLHVPGRQCTLRAMVGRKTTATQPLSVIRVPREPLIRKPRSHSRSTTTDGGWVSLKNAKLLNTRRSPRRKSRSSQERASDRLDNSPPRTVNARYCDYPRIHFPAIKNDKWTTPRAQRRAKKRWRISRRSGRRHSGRYSLSCRPKPSHRASTANSLSLSLSPRLRLRPGLSPTSHRNPRSHHHSRTYLRT
jgi:hypothetical protein